MTGAVTLYRRRSDPLTISAEVWEELCRSVWGACPAELSEEEAGEFAGLIRECQREADPEDPNTDWLEWRSDKLRQVWELREFLEGVGVVRVEAPPKPLRAILSPVASRSVPPPRQVTPAPAPAHTQKPRARVWNPPPKVSDVALMLRSDFRRWQSSEATVVFKGWYNGPPPLTIRAVLWTRLQDAIGGRWKGGKRAVMRFTERLRRLLADPPEWLKGADGEAAGRLCEWLGSFERVGRCWVSISYKG